MTLSLRKWVDKQNRNTFFFCLFSFKKLPILQNSLEFCFPYHRFLGSDRRPRVSPTCRCFLTDISLFRTCPWEIHKYPDYRAFSGPGQTDDVTVHLLLHVNPAGHCVEAFRCAVNGPSLDIDFRGEDVFQLELLHPFHFRYSVDTDNIDIKANAFSSKWQDFEDLLARGFISAFRSGQKEDKTTDVRKIMEDVGKSDQNFGASLRWAVQAKEDDSIKLSLQCLPRAASRLKRDSKLCTDECPSIILESVTAVTNFTTEGPCQGPKPILFARDPEAVKKTLTEHPNNLYTGRYNILNPKGHSRQKTANFPI